MSLVILERIEARLDRIDAAVNAVLNEQKRIGLRVAERDVACARCALQLCEAPTEPPPEAA